MKSKYGNRKTDNVAKVKAAFYFRISCLGLIVALGAPALGGSIASETRNDSVPVAAPVNTDSAGKARVAAHKSVVHVMCPKEDWAGTGFVHKSGKIITAQHVIHPCSEIFIVPSEGPPILSSVIASDEDLDLALLVPGSPMDEIGLPISTRTDLVVGTQVSTWGFPAGYPGREPLLSVGYLAGATPVKTASNGSKIQQWVVNAAFNGGNSGGPLLDIETGEVIGVVASKLAPISPSAASALEALKGQQSGFMYTATRPDGSKFNISEGQVVELVLRDLRNQIQLVIGMAVRADDLTKFLRSHQLEP
jgi:S1-C subfamily serine protease